MEADHPNYGVLIPRLSTGYAELSINQEIKELKTLAQEYRDTAPLSKRLDATALEEAAGALTHGGTLTAGLIPREQEVEQKREEERQCEQQQERDREEISLQKDTPFRFRSMSVEEIERELMGVDHDQPETTPKREIRELIKREPTRQHFSTRSVEEIERDLMGSKDEQPAKRPEAAEDREQNIWDQLDQIGRDPQPEIEPYEGREPRFVQRKPPLTDKENSISADRLTGESERQRESERRNASHPEKEPWEVEMEEYHKTREFWSGQGSSIDAELAELEGQSEEPITQDRDPTFEEFMAKLEADEREMIANERKRAKALLDEIEAKREQDPYFVPNANAFALEVEKQSIELNSEERFRARQLGIEHECVERLGLSYGY